MRRLSLGTLLTLVNVGLVIAAVVCVVLAAAGLAGRLVGRSVGAAGRRGGGAGPRPGFHHGPDPSGRSSGRDPEPRRRAAGGAAGVLEVAGPRRRGTDRRTSR